MPSGKYYCDYCEKEFQDTQVARKRHLQSKPHLRAKALWYSSSSDLNPQVSNFATKGLCNSFITSNFCPFGNSCRYVHPRSNTGSTGFTSNTQPHPDMLNQHIQGDFFSGRPGTGWFDLPPSLKPPPEQGYPQLPSIDWG
ncbi:PREDICTED: zinc finger CCCH domain-containing protein 3-like isoform X2 [Camelina sativa]|uniref:Zinc finger CCCH domain-containing protein 3-like isoform X2 n=1 Tax=Camelina sativa TaxID=90675 RepID=A0ABM0Y185_CAMSA|nr:PREDICTED: zinc finger CCCH domain-containing protein 3-like isoform X2 [Camelina sativa]